MNGESADPKPATYDLAEANALRSYGAYLDALRGYAEGRVSSLELWRASYARMGVERDLEAAASEGNEKAEAQARPRLRLTQGGRSQ